MSADLFPLSANFSGDELTSRDPASLDLATTFPELAQQLESLGAQLVWRIGKSESQDGVVVRLGYASATPRFAHLARLRSASDTELQEALTQGTLMVEWVD